MIAELLRTLRRGAGLSQRDLAAAGGTSGPTIAAYESGTKVPRADTLLRLVGASGYELTLAPARTRNERFVDLLCERIAFAVESDPSLLEQARPALARLEGRSGWTDAWRAVLDAGPEAVVAVLTSRSPSARPLKSDTPLAFVVEVSSEERTRLLEAARET